MTGENVRLNFDDELVRAAEAARAAELLASNGLTSDAVSRLYYALLHSVRALIFSKGLEPRSHEGALRLFGLHFVKEGMFTRADSHLFARMMKFREEADYNPSYPFGSEDVVALIVEVNELRDRIARHLELTPKASMSLPKQF